MEHRQIEENNQEQFLNMLAELDPELYLIKIALLQTQVNPTIIPRIIRVLGNMNIGTGYGEITILMKERIITQVKANESDVLNMPVDKQTEP
jgi:hypothetical protein